MPTPGMPSTAPETWSAQKYADLTGCQRAVAGSAPTFITVQRAEVLPDEYAQPVTVEWLVRHLLHDAEHHVLDVRRGYATLAMGDFPEVSFSEWLSGRCSWEPRRSSGRRGDGSP